MSTADGPTASCFICRKHAGLEEQPPGCYISEDECWRVCHAPRSAGACGTLLIEARRHVLDFAGMTPGETTSYGGLLARLTRALKSVTGAERVYLLTTCEGAAHFHTWMVPRLPDAQQRGLDLLGATLTCTEDEAISLVERVRAALQLN